MTYVTHNRSSNLMKFLSTTFAKPDRALSKSLKTALDCFLIIFFSASCISADVMTNIALMLYSSLPAPLDTKSLNGVICFDIAVIERSRYFSILLTCFGGSYFLKPFKYFQSLTFIHFITVSHSGHAGNLDRQLRIKEKILD